jgi:hypothetical protein
MGGWWRGALALVAVVALAGSVCGITSCGDGVTPLPLLLHAPAWLPIVMVGTVTTSDWRSVKLVLAGCRERARGLVRVRKRFLPSFLREVFGSPEFPGIVPEGGGRRAGIGVEQPS